jgi:hypothetical protein
MADRSRQLFDHIPNLMAGASARSGDAADYITKLSGKNTTACIGRRRWKFNRDHALRYCVMSGATSRS